MMLSFFVKVIGKMPGPRPIKPDSNDPIILQSWREADKIWGRLWDAEAERQREERKQEGRPKLRIVRPDEPARKRAEIDDVLPCITKAWSARNPNAPRQHAKSFGPDELFGPRIERASLPLIGRPGYLFELKCHLITSAPGAGKTHLLTAGLTDLAAIGVRIAWVTEEDLGNFQDHIGLVAPKPWTGDLRWFEPDGVATDYWLADDVMRWNPDVIVVDTLRTVLSPEDEANAADITKVVRPWIALCKGEGKTLIVTHHDRKGGNAGHWGAKSADSVSGTNALVGAFDVLIQIDYWQNDEDDTRRVVRVSRRVPRQYKVKTVYTIDPATERPQWDDLSASLLRDTIKGTGKRSVDERIMETVKAHEGRWLTRDDFSEAIPDVSAGTVANALSVLTNSAKLIKDGRGPSAAWALPGTVRLADI